jgi:hypothetical protein
MSAIFGYPGKAIDRSVDAVQRALLPEAQINSMKAPTMSGLL